MKEILADQTKKGDLIYFDGSYREVVSDKRFNIGGYLLIQTKCIMCSTPTKEQKNLKIDLDIGTVSYLASHFKVMLLCRDGEEV